MVGKTIKVGVSGYMFKLTKAMILSKSIPKHPDIYLIKREQEPNIGKIVIPGGKLEFDETCEEGIKRELFEETGYQTGFIHDLIPSLTSTQDNYHFTNIVDNLIFHDIGLHYVIVSKM